VKNILITGAFGFVGTNFIQYLSITGTYNLIAVDLVKKSNCPFSSFYKWSELRQVPWNDLDTVIHLAGLSHDTKNVFESSKYFDINVGLTKIVFDFYLNAEVEKFVLFSSVKAVADSIESNILTEDVAPAPQTPYGKSKLEAEYYILNQQIAEDKKVYILRPCMIHGPGNQGNLNLLYKFVKTGFPYPLGAFENKRSFTSIENINFIIKQIIEREINPGIYQVSDDEPLSTNEVIAHIAMALNKKERIWKINQHLIKQIARLGDILHLPFNNEHLKKLTENYVVSNRKLISELGMPLPISSREGLLRTVRSFSER